MTGSIDSFNQFVLGVLMYPTPQGALTQLWAGTSPDTADLNGAVSTPHYLPQRGSCCARQYLCPWARVSKPRSNDPELGRDLWAWFEEQVANL